MWDSARAVLGLIVLFVVLYLFSENKKAISWRLIGTALVLQFVFAGLILHVAAFQTAFEFISSFFVAVLKFTEKGSIFLFGDLVDTSKQVMFLPFKFYRQLSSSQP